MNKLTSFFTKPTHFDFYDVREFVGAKNMVLDFHKKELAAWTDTEGMSMLLTLDDDPNYLRWIVRDVSKYKMYPYYCGIPDTTLAKLNVCYQYIFKTDTVGNVLFVQSIYDSVLKRFLHQDMFLDVADKLEMRCHEQLSFDDFSHANDYIISHPKERLIINGGFNYLVQMTGKDYD